MNIFSASSLTSYLPPYKRRGKEIIHHVRPLQKKKHEKKSVPCANKPLSFSTEAHQKRRKRHETERERDFERAQHSDEMAASASPPLKAAATTDAFAYIAPTTTLSGRWEILHTPLIPLENDKTPGAKHTHRVEPTRRDQQTNRRRQPTDRPNDRTRTRTFLLQVKHRFLFFCSGLAGASSAAASAAASIAIAAPAAPSASAPPPIAGAAADPPALNDSGLGDGATDNDEGEAAAAGAAGAAAGAEIGAGGWGRSTDADSAVVVAAVVVRAPAAGAAGVVRGEAAPAAASEGGSPSAAAATAGAAAGAESSDSSIAVGAGGGEGLLKVNGGNEADPTAGVDWGRGFRWQRRLIGRHRARKGEQVKKATAITKRSFDGLPLHRGRKI